ncbi:GGDEF domain-containing protein [Hydrogenophaga soli]
MTQKHHQNHNPVARQWFHQSMAWVLGTSKPMRIRTSQFLLAALLMVACVGVLYFVQAIGTEGMGDVGTWAAFSCGGLVVIYGLIRSGLSQRFSDPSLAFAQMLYAIACDAAAFVIAGHSRGVTLPILSVILMFGMFGLSLRQVVFVAVYGLCLFSLAALHVAQRLVTDEPVGLLAAYVFMAFVVLSATTFLTWRLQLMSAYMRNKKNELKSALDKINLIATRDELTGVFNRRHMLEKIAEESQRANRQSQALLFAILDVDHFKQINDTHGHQAGDVALQAFASVVLGTLRAHDTLARWGGEEFVILLTDTDPASGQICLERVRAKVADAVVNTPTGAVKMTVSIGVTQYRPGEDTDKTMARADAALYAAKLQGRNRTEWG